MCAYWYLPTLLRIEYSIRDEMSSDVMRYGWYIGCLLCMYLEVTAGYSATLGIAPVSVKSICIVAEIYLMGVLVPLLLTCLD